MRPIVLFCLIVFWVMSVTNLSFSALAYFFKDDIDAARELAIRGLCIYLNEDPKDLIQEYVVSGYSTDSIGQAMFNKQYITTSKNHGFI